MTAVTKRSWRIWALLGLAGVVALAAFAPGGTPEADQGKSVRARPTAPTPAPLARRSDKRTAEVGRIELERLRRLQAQQDESVQTAGAFAASTWYVPPPPPPPPPPPKPTAPPMPFTYLGVYEEAGSKVVILAKADRVYTVPEGTVIENTYRVGHVKGGKLELIYLPLNITQYLSTGEA